MTRYACFEIKTTCGRCGQPVPVNGPLRTLPCPSCFEEVHVTADVLAGFLNDFEEEHEGYEEGEGSGGTLFCGAGQFEYGYWRLRPRCSECKQVLPEVEPGTEGTGSGRNQTRYLYPDEIEPLIRDAVALGKAIEAVSTGRDVKLPV